MNSSNCYMLYYAAKRGFLEKVNELLSEGTETGYRDEVTYHVIFIKISIILLMIDDDDDVYICCWH